DSLREDFYRYPALHPVMAWKDSVRPYPPRGIQYAYHWQAGRTVLQWELPLTAPDGDSAYRYAVYLFDHYPAAAEFEDPRNLISIEGRRFIALPEEAAGTGSLYLAVTALDRNYNESDTSNILKITAPTSPVLASPADGTANLPASVKVTWRTAQLASSYRLQVSTDPTFSDGVLLDEGSIVDTFRVVGDLFAQATHYWRVSASNPAGSSFFSSPFHFLTGFPTTVTLLSPPDVTEEVPVDVNLVWRASEAATSYHVQLSPAGDFSVLILDSTGLSDTTTALAGLDQLRVYFWRVMAENPIGCSPWSSTYRFRTVQVTSVGGEDEVPTEYALQQNYPNPFNAMTTIQFAIPKAGRVLLKVYDMLGRERATLVDREMTPGTFSVQWDASDLASGVYLYRLVSGSFVATKRMIVLK
ncbi:MAG: T9SS type A sorting domain-containing protein, partial [Bacteroidota bacterium]